MDWIQTYTGKRFYPLKPREADIDITDIAHALSLLCRFNGHCRVFYSVAEHSVRVAQSLPEATALWGLLHDAAEAYLTDIPRPIKRQMPWFQETERTLLRVIAKRFDLSWPMPEAVIDADNQLLATEARDLMVPPPASWGLSCQPLETTIEPWPPQRAADRFLATYSELALSG